MRLLLDSHAYLWWLAGSAKLSGAAAAAIADRASTVWVSAATIWELEIKAALGRLEWGDADLVDEIGLNGFVELPVSSRHAQAAARLARHHDDPFDRMLIAQARVEGLSCVTRDPVFAGYGVKVLW